MRQRGSQHGNVSQSAVSNPLLALVRLLARHAVRELVDEAPAPPPERNKTRANDRK
jgi:hypothetical protein